MVVKGFKEFLRHNPNTNQVDSALLFCLRRSFFSVQIDRIISLQGRGFIMNLFGVDGVQIFKVVWFVCLFLKSLSYWNKVG